LGGFLYLKTAQLRSFGPNVANIPAHLAPEPKVSVACGAGLDGRISMSSPRIGEHRRATARTGPKE
jgi:hypothetical protein